MGKVEKDLQLAKDTELASILGALSRNKSADVRLLVVNNKHTSIDVVQSLLEDENSTVRESANSRFAEMSEALKPTTFFKHCNGCGTKVSSEANFCRQCGTSINWNGPKCESCIVEFEDDSVYCKFCGKRLTR